MISAAWTVTAASVAVAAPVADPLAAPTTVTPALIGDDLPNSFGAKRREMREQAVSDLISGRLKTQKRGASTVAKVGKTFGTGETGRELTDSGSDQYVELSREKTDRIFVILAEFGNDRHPSYPDIDSNPATPGPIRFDGPLHNQIPEPNRSVNNSAIWQSDYSADHYRNLYFGTGAGTESVKTYFETQSSGRYSVDGKVTDWVKVPFNEARYGRDLCGRNWCDNTWALVRDAANTWVADQRAAGRSAADIAADLRSFDTWDRYDNDGDGDFNEPDGYLDHFQVVHAGGDQADGSPEGEDGIWSHRWYAYDTDLGHTGPTGNLRGGTQIGDTGMWIGDYTIQPENGGLSVFAHEYGHDLDLPDDYDTVAGVATSNGHWTAMAQHRLSGADEQGIGIRTGDLGAWNKLQLGWLAHETVDAGQSRTLDLGPQEYNTAKAQGVVVELPKKVVITAVGAPFAGTKQYFSGNDDNLNTTQTREFDFTGKSTASLKAKARYGIEAGYDYLYLEASDDNGATWSPLDATLNGVPIGRDASDNPAIDGSSNGAWLDLTVSLNAYVGKKALFRFHYRTDSNTFEGGFFADDIVVAADGGPLLTDDAESPTTWTLKGFGAVGTNVTTKYDNYYVAGNRSYVSYDRYLKSGPFSFAKRDFVENYAYQQGLLISYWDTSQRDNNTSVHPGSGKNLVIDSHPAPLYDWRGRPWLTPVQVYDAPFSLTKADSFTLQVQGQASDIKGQDAQPLFDDTQRYWYQELKDHGVKLPAAGVKIEVLQQNGTSLKVQIS